MFPVLKGLGYGMLSINIIINFYYTVIMAWSLIYMYEVSGEQSRLKQLCVYTICHYLIKKQLDRSKVIDKKGNPQKNQIET